MKIICCFCDRQEKKSGRKWMWKLLLFSCFNSAALTLGVAWRSSHYFGAVRSILWGHFESAFADNSTKFQFPFDQWQSLEFSRWKKASFDPPLKWFLDSFIRWVQPSKRAVFSGIEMHYFGKLTGKLKIVENQEKN